MQHSIISVFGWSIHLSLGDLLTEGTPEEVGKEFRLLRVFFMT
jgi:hypothetical protein